MATLHTEFSSQIIDENKITAADRKTFAYISQYGDIAYDAVVAEETDWQVFQNLSELRQGLLSWYDFPSKARVLEIGAGFGALTGLLCRKCDHVTATDRSLFRAQAVALRYKYTDNLEVYAGDAQDINFPENFDYIIVIGLLERIGKGSSEPDPYAAYLSSLRKWLKTGGRFLIAVENRFGVRYFCGEPEPHTKRAFDGINRYMWGTSGYSFSRQELVDVVQAAGLGYHRFYYPLPDYRLPQLIYTDGHLPEKNLPERLIPYYQRQDMLVANEKGLYEDIIENNVFPFFANSFLLECGTTAFSGCIGGKDENGAPGVMENVDRAEGRKRGENGEGRVQYAAVSTDRGQERSYATTIRSDGKVYKAPLYEQGRLNARKLYGNLLDLEEHGIPVVRHRLLEGDVLEMPYISWPTLSNYIKEIMGRDEEKFLGLLDRIYAYILQSSEQVPEEGTESCFGPILKKAYMELIPLNCFYNPETGEFLYFDQEFVRENYPAKYVLFRAIYYIYCFTPNAERYYPRKKLLQKYDMEDTWDIYLREETRFLDEVRNRQQYRLFYQKSRVERNWLLENVRRLETGAQT